MSRRRPLLMGIVNVTPDSFSDGGRFLDAREAIDHGVRLLDEGADWVDVGGESTRPGARPVSAREEIQRVIPVIEGLIALRPEGRVSVDTAKAEVAARAIDAGARMVNDVTALRDPEMAPLCARAGVDIILMHMRGTPETMQSDTAYDDLVQEVEAFLRRRAESAVDHGIGRSSIWLDPGLGFGKAPLENPCLIASIPRFERIGFPIVVGASRKRFVGEITGVTAPGDRLHGSIGAALAAAARGARMIRVHDVAPTRQALEVFCSVRP